MDIKMIGKVARNRLIQDLFSAFQKQLNLSEEEISKFRYEAFLVESNEEQILKWEEFMNLEEKPDYSLQDRIDRVLFTLQSRGSFTPDFLKEQAKIFMNGIIDIEELFNEYSFTLVFKDIVGVPPNLENFRAMLELNKPAHLTYKFKFRYNTHGQLEVLTHGEMEQYTHDELYQKRVFEDSQLPDGTPIVRTARFLKSIVALIFPLKTDYYNVDIFNDNFKYLDEHKLEKGGYTGTAQNLLTEISKIASKSVLGRIIIGKGISVDSSGRTSIVSKNDGIIVNENDIQLDTVDNVTTDSGTKPLSARQGKKLEENKQNKNDNTLKTTAKNIVGAINELFSEKANKAHSHGNSEITDIDASKIKTGTIDISRLPQAALERCVVVADDTARFKLTKEQVQVGDSVKVTNPDNLMYIVVDDTKLNVEAGYVAYSAAIKWDGIKDKPSVFPPSSHTHTKNQITDFAHTHDDRYYTEAEIDTKFKNYCPISVGSIDVRYDNKNPAELYPSTTWELLAAGKYIQSGSTALQTGGSNSINIAKTNLPNVKLSIGSFSATIGAHNHYIFANGTGSDSSNVNLTPVTNRHNSASVEYVIHWSSTRANKGRTSDSGNGTTGSVSPYTESLGSGTALTVQPAYITLKFWKRLS